MGGRHLNDDGNDLAVETGQAVASTLGLLRAPLGRAATAASSRTGTAARGGDTVAQAAAGYLGVMMILRPGRARRCCEPVRRAWVR